MKSRIIDIVNINGHNEADEEGNYANEAGHWNAKRTPLVDLNRARRARVELIEGRSTGNDKLSWDGRDLLHYP